MSAIAFIAPRAIPLRCSIAVLMLVTIASVSVRAATLTVTDKSTFVGANVGCSLARAVSYINAGGPTDGFGYCTNSGGAYGSNDVIEFAIGFGTPTITVTNNSVTYIEIPTIRKPVLIDGTSAGTLRVELVPSVGVTSPALRVASSGVTLANLVIHGFPLAQIDIEGAGGVHDDEVIGSYIGTDATGMTASSNNSWGIRVIGATRVTVGALTAGSRNVIAGNAYGGLQIAGGSSSVLVYNNAIGVGADGVTPLGNCGDGSDASCAGIVIGPRADHIDITAGNVIGANHGHGIRIAGTGGFMPGDDPTNVSITGNFIGVSADGSVPLPNDGIAANQSCGIKMVMSTVDVVSNTIGGFYSGLGNVIANNGYCGIGVTGGSVVGTEPTNLVEIESNTFFGNGQLAIDLSSTLTGDDATANDANGHSGGPNLFQNYPMLSRAWSTATGQLYVSGQLASSTTPNQESRVEVFSNPSGQAQGTHWRGYFLLRTDAAGDARFEDQGPFTLPTSDSDITLTVTADYGTSEMSPSVVSSASHDIIFANSFDSCPAPGWCL